LLSAVFFIGRNARRDWQAEKGQTMKQIFSRSIFTLALAMLSLAPAQAQTRVGYMPIAEELPKMVAIEKGFFKAQGLDAELVRFESGPDMGTALLGGSIQFGMIGTPGLVNAAVAGRPLVAIVDNGSNAVGPAGYEYYTGLVVLDGSSVKTIGDLKGKKIAVNVLKANSEAQTVMQILRWNKEHPDRSIDINKDIQFITIPFGSMPAALQQDRVDAASMIEPFMTQLAAGQKVRIIAPVSYAMEQWPVSFGVVKEDFREKNPDVLRKYTAAWFQAVDWIAAHPDEARSFIPKYTGVPAEVAKSIVLPHWSKDLKAPEHSTELLMSGMLEGGMIQKKADLSKVFVVGAPTAK
jgi:NitT/TauT family transport system substrate-binding protein